MKADRARRGRKRIDRYPPNRGRCARSVAPERRALEPRGRHDRISDRNARVGEGTIAVIGGTEVFELFLPLYDAFHLTRAAHAAIPGGSAGFPGGRPGRDAGDVLARHGLRAGPQRELDAAAGITLVHVGTALPIMQACCPEIGSAPA